MKALASGARRLAGDVNRYGIDYLWWRYWKSRELPRLGPFPFSLGGPEVHMVTCHRDATEASWALASWWAVGGSRGSVILHDDGSLTERDVARFRALFPGLQVVRREEADRAVTPRLAGLPACVQFRARHPLALKLIDCALLGASHWFTLLDSDLLFFAPVDEVLQAARARWGESVNIFMEDYQPSYSLHQDEIGRLLGRPFHVRINTGLALIRRESVDLAKVESYLTDCPAVTSNLSWAEQTLYALLTGGHAGLLDQRCQVARHPGVVGIAVKHYVRPVRGLFYAEGLELVMRDLLRISNQGRVG